MSKQSNKKISVAEIIQLFKTAPEQGYEQLISSSHYYYTKHSEAFWTAYIQLDHKGLNKQFPDSVTIFNRVAWLKLFYDLKMFYCIEKVKNISELLALNPDETSLTKSLFLCLELGDTTPQPSNFPTYTEESLQAIKILLDEILPKLKKENKTSYSVELTQLSLNLIKIQIDIALLAEFLDAFVWAYFEMQQKENAIGFELRLPDKANKEENLFVINYLKTAVKRDFKRKESHPKISEEEHFQKNDPTWKTQEGLATVFHSSNMTVTSQTPGTTAFQVEDDSWLTNMISKDPKTSNEAIFKMMMLSQEQNFHHQFRQALSQVYQPNDEIDIHALHLEIKPNIFVTLYDLLCVMSCLIARADVFRYYSDFPMASIKTIKNQLLIHTKQQYPELNIEQLHESTNFSIVKGLPDIEKLKEQLAFPFFDLEMILGWLKKIEELKSKSESELNAMIDLLTSFESPLRFNPLYKIDGKYYFSYTTCGRFNLNQLLYDNYITDKLFSLKFKALNEQKEISSRSNSRAENFANSTRDLLRKVTPFVESNIYYGGHKNNWEFGELEGDIDVVAFFEDENILLSIQIKLSNVSQKKESERQRWVNTKIYDEGKTQIQKDMTILKAESGLKFIADKLGIKKEIKHPVIYPLIVTDNFFADHTLFTYNEQGDHVFCVSYFELKHLLLNQKIHDKQTEWLPFESSNAASRLIEVVEANSFWSFLGSYAKAFKFNKALCAINEDFKIGMIV